VITDYCRKCVHYWKLNFANGACLLNVKELDDNGNREIYDTNVVFIPSNNKICSDYIMADDQENARNRILVD